MKKVLLVLAFILALPLIIVDQSSAQIPRTLSYQGVLTDTLGNPRPDGSYTFTFRLYETGTGGTPIWTEAKALNVQRGLFSTTLGDITSLATLDFDRPYWLSIQVGSDPELQPRIGLTSVGYAFTALKADTADYALASTTSGNAGGDLVGTYPNPAIRVNAVTSEKIANDAVTTEKIQDAAVTQSKLAPGVSLPPGGAAGGDLSGKYPNPTIADNAVTTTKILDNAVTSDKIQDATIQQVDLAFIPATRPLAPPVATSEIAEGAVTSAKIQDGTVQRVDVTPSFKAPAADTADYARASVPGGTAGGDLTGTYPDPTITSGAVTTTKLADNAVTAPKITDGAVTSAKILDGAVAGADLANNAVTTAKITDGTIQRNDVQANFKAPLADTSDFARAANLSGSGGDLTGTYPNPTIAANAVTSAKIADGAVTSAKILDGAVAGADLANNAVTAAKIADGTIQRSDVQANFKAPLADTSDFARAATLSLPFIGSAAVGAGQVFQVTNTSTSGTSRAIYGLNNSMQGFGVHGEATSTGGTNYGVRGQSSSSGGFGVHGMATATSGFNYGVYGQTSSSSGRGVVGWATASTGTNYGVFGATDSPSGYAGYFQGNLHVTGALSAAAGGDLTGSYPSPIIANAAVTPVKINSSGATGGQALTFNGANVVWGIPNGRLNLPYEDSASVAGNDRAAFKVTNTSTVGVTIGIFGKSSEGPGVYGESPSYGVRGFSPATGVVGSGNVGVHGRADATSGGTTGVMGTSASPGGKGVFGWATATSGTPYGVYGEGGSSSGSTGVYGQASTYGVHGVALSGGVNYGVYGKTFSPTGYAGYFEGNAHVTGTLTAGNLILSGAAGGDLTGTYPNPTIAGSAVTSAKIADATIDFVDIGQNGAAAEQVIKWSGSAWVSRNDSIGLPLAGGTMTGAISNTGNPPITMGKGNFGSGNTNTGADAFVAGTSNAASGNIAAIGGGFSNTASGGLATVGGGAQNVASGIVATVDGGGNNIASGDNTTVGGGGYNIASNLYATVAGGSWNRARGQYSVVSGGGGAASGDSNAAIGDYSTIGGGLRNSASRWATVGGGQRNTASGQHATVGGGNVNIANTLEATVGGGIGNTASGIAATVGGGNGNTASGYRGTASGGEGNTASGNLATVGGGIRNTASGEHATIGGGNSNAASGFRATVGGGEQDSALGESSTVPGGYNNRASGFYSFAAGVHAKALHNGAFVWADQNFIDFASTGANQFLIRASGGVGIGTTTPAATLHVNGTAGNNTGVWSNLSDRRLKTDVEPILNALRTVEQLEGVTFRWKDEKKDAEFGRVRGLIAQDVEKVIPEWVRTDPDGHKRIEPIGINALLIEAIKEQQQEIEELRAIVKSLISEKNQRESKSVGEVR